MSRACGPGSSPRTSWSGATPTAYVRVARAAGATALDGVGMMVGRAAVNFHLWTGVEPDPTSCARPWNHLAADEPTTLFVRGRFQPRREAGSVRRRKSGA